MQVCGQEFSESLLGRIQQMMDREPSLSRVAVSRQVCQWLDWRAPNGKLKEMSCRVALLKLHRRGVLCLPPAAPRPARDGRAFGTRHQRSARPIEQKERHKWLVSFRRVAAL